MKLYNKSELMPLLESFGFNFSKTLGQNFLIDKNILDKIIDNSNINKNTNVLEIGPGAGTLTYELCKRAKKIVSIEIDNALIPILQHNLSEFNNFTLINDDIMKIDLKKVISDNFGSEKFILAANLPYYITTPIIMNIFEGGFNVESMILMIQKEVADRIYASPGTKNYGALTVGVGFYARPEIICQAPPHCFTPQPKVSSVVIKLNVYEKPPYYVNNKEMFFKTVKSVFSQRRKTLVNSLSGSPFINCDKVKIEKNLKNMDLDLKIRGEKLSIEQLAELSNQLFK